MSSNTLLTIWEKIIQYFTAGSFYLYGLLPTGCHFLSHSGMGNKLLAVDTYILLFVFCPRNKLIAAVKYCSDLTQNSTMNPGYKIVPAGLLALPSQLVGGCQLAVHTGIIKKEKVF